MSMQGIVFQPVKEECPYLEGLEAVNENMLVKKVDAADLDILLARGVRHFGEFFFRPLCHHCRCCIPIRIPVGRFVPSKGVKRLLGRSRPLACTLERLRPSREAYRLYRQHKKRFAAFGRDSYELYVKSFYHPFPFSRTLCIRDGERLVALSHLDVTRHSISAIYTYFDDEYARFSPGRLSVYKTLQLAQERGIDWLYLGFYVAQNRHMKYKIEFKPNQLMGEDEKWFDYIDAAGTVLAPLPRPGFFQLFDYGDLDPVEPV